MKRSAVVCGLAASLLLAGPAGAQPADEDSLDELLASPPEESSAAAAASPEPAAAQAAPAAGADAAAPATIPVKPLQEEEPARPASRPPRRGPLSIEEIVVTAQRREENLSEIPLAITAYSGKDLNALGVSDTRDLGKIVPGFVASDSGYSVPVYSLRGIGFNDISYSSTGTVGVYANEVSLPYAIMTRGANLDLQRVEVLKGPQGTLYGRNSTGGTVNYIANAPTEELAGALNLSYSRFNTIDGEGFISGPLGDSLSGRLAMRATESKDPWQRSQTRPDDRMGEISKQAARGILEWQAAESFKLSFTASGWRDESDPQAPFAVAFFAQNVFTGETTADPQVQHYPYRPDNDDPRNADWAPEKDWQLHDRFWNAALRADWGLAEELDLTGLLSYGRFNSDQSAFPQSGNGVLQSEQEITAQIQTIGSELRLAGLLGEDIRWIAGLSASFDETSEFHKVFIEHNSFNFPPPGVGNPTGMAFLDDKVGQIGDTQAESYGVFGNLEWRFAEALKFTQGLRYTTESRSYQGCTMVAEDSVGVVGLSNLFSAVALASGPDDNAQQILQSILAGDTMPLIDRGECFVLDENNVPGLFKGTLEEQNLATRTVLDWTPAEGLLFYGSYTRGYKSGGFPVILAARQSAYRPVTQERLIAYELGAKTTLLDSLMRLDAAAFYYDYKDKQLLTFELDEVFGSLPVIRNAPKSTVYGAEFSLNTTPMEGLYLALVASYIRTEINEFVSTTMRGTEFDFAGRPFNFAPEIQTTLIGAYSMPLQDSLLLTLGADATYASATNGTLEGNPDYVIPSYRMYGARIKLESEANQWGVTLFGRNLTNEVQRLGVFRTGDSVAATTAFPRSYGLSFEYRY